MIRSVVFALEGMGGDFAAWSSLGCIDIGRMIMSFSGHSTPYSIKMPSECKI